ncbi:MAG: 4'-phosphopantetheinyl transferase superfamily protein [Bacilli bacterium]|nr:4'-phosphopantetheinyl transferase superfamily protein [Bacilli bacterium]
MKVYLIKNKDNKRNWLSILFNIIQRDFNLSYNQDDLSYNEYGKPFINGSPLYFNVSHSSLLLAIAISTKDVGIDIEKVKERKHIDKIVNKAFLEPEKNVYHNNKDINYFYEIWTKKEAFVKLIGTGIVGYFNNVPEKYHFYVKTNKYTIDNEDYYLSIASFNSIERNNWDIIYE